MCSSKSITNESVLIFAYRNWNQIIASTNNLPVHFRMLLYSPTTKCSVEPQRRPHWHSLHGYAERVGWKLLSGLLVGFFDICQAIVIVCFIQFHCLTLWEMQKQLHPTLIFTVEFSLAYLMANNYWWTYQIDWNWHFGGCLMRNVVCLWKTQRFQTIVIYTRHIHRLCPQFYILL